jgi:large subunit ribosomal protein L5e
MRALKDGDEEKQAAYAKQFKRFIDAEIGPDDVEGVYTEAHKAIRADPLKKRDPLELGFHKKRSAPKDPKAVVAKKKFGQQPISVEQRKNRIKQVLNKKGLVAIKLGGTAKAV